MSLLSTFLQKHYLALSQSGSLLSYTLSQPTVLIDSTDVTAGGINFPALQLRNAYQAVGSGGKVQWLTKNSVGTVVTAAEIKGSMWGITSGAETGRIEFIVKKAATTQTLNLDSVNGDVGILMPSLTSDIMLGSVDNGFRALWLSEAGGATRLYIAPAAGALVFTTTGLSGDIKFSLGAVESLHMAGTRIALGGNTTTQSMALLTSDGFISTGHPAVGTSAYGLNVTFTIPANVTSESYAVRSRLAIASAAFTITNLGAIFADDAVDIGAGTITNQYGVRVGTLTVGTNNYGFYGEVATAANRWNVYMVGTAPNHLAAALGIGTTTVANLMLNVATATAATQVAKFANTNAAVTSDVLTVFGQNSSSAYNAINAIDNAGNVKLRVRGDGVSLFGTGTILNSALLTVGGRLAVTFNNTYDLSGATTAESVIIEGNATVAASQTNQGFVTRQAASTIATNGVVSGYAALLTATSADSTGHLRGFTSIVQDAGPGATYGSYLRVLGGGGHTGTLRGVFADMRPAATSGVAHGVHITLLSNTLTSGFLIDAAAGTVTYGIDIQSTINVGTAAFRYSQKSGSTADFLRYVDSSAVQAFTVDSVGNVLLASGKAFKINALQLVGARKTGWTTWTGTATRTGFATSTATLVNVAETLKALIDDLHGTAGHGLIGT